MGGGGGGAGICLETLLFSYAFIMDNLSWGGGGGHLSRNPVLIRFHHGQLEFGGGGGGGDICLETLFLYVFIMDNLSSGGGTSV